MITQELLDNNFARNIISLEKYYPDLFDLYKDYKEKRYFLVYDAVGDYNLYDTELERNVYSASPMQACAEVLMEYESSPVYFSKLMGSANDLSSQVNPIHTKYVKTLANIAFVNEKLNGLEKKLPHDINFMVCIGVGLGHDIEYMLKNKKVDKLCILEKDPDIFYASLFLVDWSGIFDEAVSSKKRIDIHIDEDDSQLLSKFYNTVVSFGHYNANSLYLYAPLNLDSYQVFYENVSEFVRGRLLAGFGFYDDSRLSVAATIGNVKQKVPVYIKKKSMPNILSSDDTPVFVVGAGPSLDNDIDFIKRNQKKAIIISCGSGIKPLEKNGIVPDFHFECERTAFTKHWLDQVDHNFLNKLNFIGLNLIYPDVFKMFKRCGMLAKSSETGSFMLAKAVEAKYGKAILPIHTHVNPTVVHMGVGVAPFLGLKKIYLFGVDMGYKDPNQHHSVDSSYTDLKDTKKSMFAPSESREIKSNFDDSVVYTDDGYISFRLFLEGIIDSNRRIFKDFECFNCSDGAYIKGANPLLDRDFLLNNKELDKEFIANNIMDQYFDSNVCSEIEGGLKDIVDIDRALVKSACIAMAKHFDGSFESVDDAKKVIDKAISRLFHTKEFFEDDKAYLLSIFSGSMQYLFSTMVRIIYSRSPVNDNKIALINSGMSLISEFFMAVGEDFSDNYDKNDDMSLYDLF